MIDTIILRIHDINKYTKLIENIRSISAKDGLLLRRLGKPGEAIPEAEKDYLEFMEMEYMNENEFSRKRNVLLKDKIFLPSSHYKLAWRANFEHNYIELNFSIPKLIYGTNIIQFVRHYNEFSNEIFDLEKQNTWRVNREQTFYRLKSFLEKFFMMYLTWQVRDEFDRIVDMSVDKTDIEIFRIDLAFNQVFRSKVEALEYLELQKQIKKKYQRDSVKASRNFQTSVWIQTGRYVAKIYHKGSEYEKGDYKEHLKINKKFPGTFDTKMLKDISDRTLRYEISFKYKYMSYLYKNNLFRDKCHFHQRLKEINEFVRASQKRIETLRNEVSELKHSKPDTYEGKEEKRRQIRQKKSIIYNEKYKIGVMEKVLVRNQYVPASELVESKEKLSGYYESMINQITHFFWDVDDLDRKDGRYTITFKVNREGKVKTPDKYVFGIRLYRLMCKELKDFFDQYQISERTDIGKIDKVVKDWNIKAENHNEFYADEIRVKLAKRIQTYTLSHVKKVWELTRLNSFDQLVKKGLMSKAAKYRNIKMFRDLGIDINSFTSYPVNAPKDFAEYHELHFQHTGLQKLNHYFK